jgi:hypothetical protein
LFLKPISIHVITEIPVKMDNTYLRRGEDNGSEKMETKKKHCD